MDFRKTPDNIVKDLYSMLYTLDQVLVANNIPYWLNGGCLLGQVRTGSFIPWDDDIDIGVPIEYKDRCLTTLKSMLTGLTSQSRYLVWESEHGIKILQDIPPPRATGDVFFYNFDCSSEQSKWVLSYPLPRKAWPNDYFLPEEISNIKRVKFGDIEVSIPGNPLRYLKVLYGENCMTHGKLQYDHLMNKKHDKAGVEVLLK